MRGILLCLVLMMLCAPCVLSEDAQQLQGTQLDIPARGAVLIERTSGRVLYEKNADERLPMASTTKIMTALLAIEQCSMDEVVTAGKNASGVTGTSIYLRIGERLSMRNMLYGLMLRSGNDAAVAIAEHIDGSVKTFAQRMNERAMQLDADALFVTPNGLDADGHGATALGMARIARKAMEYGTFREIVKTKRATIPWPGNQYDRLLENKNRLLTDLPGATGIKTGFTNKAGRCLVFSCERDGMELIGVVLNCGSWFESAGQMIEWGFANYSATPQFVKGDVALSAKVWGGVDSSVDALYAQSLTLPCAEDEQCLILIEMGSLLRAPIEEGQQIGRALININGKTDFSVPLVAANAAEPTNLWTAFKKVCRNWRLALNAQFE